VAVEKGLINGLPDNTFDPLGFATRAQAGAMVSRLSQILFTRPVVPYQTS